MPLQATSGAASYDAFGGGVPYVPTYIEELFRTWLYTGTGANQTITNGIDLAGKGGLVWMKNRTSVQLHSLCDTVTGAQKYLNSASTAAQSSGSTFLQSFTSTGFNTGSTFSANGDNYASWTFREQPKFFDVVTWTGNGVAGRQIPHNLGSAVGCLIVKCTSAVEDWQVWHRTFAGNQRIRLNLTDAVDTAGSVVWNGVAPTSTVFTVGDNGVSNGSGRTYVAYLFAHNAGGFGLTGTDNVISCGSVTDNNRVELGYEPQFLLMKTTSGTGNWILVDTMRGLTANTSGGNGTLFANTTATEASGARYANIDATGFTSNMGAPGTHIYIAIRRGPMRAPTTGTSVLETITRTGTDVNTTVSSSVQPDFIWIKARATSSQDHHLFSRLRGVLNSLMPARTDAEFSYAGSVTAMNNNSFQVNAANDVNLSSTAYVNWVMRRASGFLDEVCWTGDGSTGRLISHNLNAPPEIILMKSRSATGDWRFWCRSNSFYAGTASTNVCLLPMTANGFNDSSSSYGEAAYFPAGLPTASNFSVVNGDAATNATGVTHVAYLFASCPGVSRVGRYTGNGSSQTINCGFTGGARFILIKRTSAAGDWYVWDTARGIISGNDPHLSLNTNAVEVTSNDTIDADNTGFVVNQVAATNVNVNAATYIFLAIA